MHPRLANMEFSKSPPARTHKRTHAHSSLSQYSQMNTQTHTFGALAWIASPFAKVQGLPLPRHLLTRHLNARRYAVKNKRR